MSTIFPGSASVGQVYNNYTFDGTAWNINGIDLTENYLEESSASATYQTKLTAGSGLSLNGSTLGVNPGAMLNTIVDGTSGNSYGLVGTSTYLDVKDTNGYNKEIELDIAAVESQLVTDGFLKNSSASGTYLTQTSASTTYLPLSAASANQIIYKNSSNVATGSSGLNYDGVSLKVNGNLESVYSNGDEGGEIFLKKAATNTTLSDGVTLDIHQNRLRIFETTGNNRGAYIDMASLPNGVNTNLVPGITLVKKQTIGSGVSSVTVSDAFNSNYDVYKIIVNGGVGSGTSNLYFQLSGITSGYSSNLNYRTFANTSNNVANATNQSVWFWIGGSSTSGQQMSIELTNPFANKPKFVVGTHYNFNGAGDVGSGIGYNDSTASATGFTISPESGTITGGTIYIYGYNKGA